MRRIYLSEGRINYRNPGHRGYPILSWKCVFIKNNMLDDDGFLGDRIIAPVTSVICAIT